MSYSDITKAANKLFLTMESLGGGRGRVDVPDSEALRRAEALLGMIDAYWAFEYSERLRAAAYLSMLTRCSAAVRELVKRSARQYVEILRECDASPWTPNAIEVLAKGPCCTELRDFLEELFEKYPGMASGDLKVALADINAGLLAMAG